MSGRLKLEDFQAEHLPMPKTEDASASALEEQVLASFENGYKAGWDDATNTHSKEQTNISSDFAQSLQELSFTYHEASGHILRSLEPLLNELIDKIFPEIIQDTLGQTVLDEVLRQSQKVGEVPVELVVHPSNRFSIEGLLKANTSLPVTLVEETCLGEGQAFLRIGTSERSIDLSGALSSLRSSFEAFFQMREVEIKNVG